MEHIVHVSAKIFRGPISSSSLLENNYDECNVKLLRRIYSRLSRGSVEVKNYIRVFEYNYFTTSCIMIFSALIGNHIPARIFFQ